MSGATDTRESLPIRRQNIPKKGLVPTQYGAPIDAPRDESRPRAREAHAQDYCPVCPRFGRGTSRATPARRRRWEIPGLWRRQTVEKKCIEEEEGRERTA